MSWQLTIYKIDPTQPNGERRVGRYIYYSQDEHWMRGELRRMAHDQYKPSDGYRLVTEPEIKDASPMDLNINWALLREQKLWLLTQESPHADGLIHLIDAVQDQAVATGSATEIEVFGVYPEEDK